MTIGKNIYNLRSKKRMSQEKLASKLGITRQTLSNYENDITSPDLEQSKKICDIFDISLDELIGNNNTISSKISITERLVKKQNKNTKIILVTLYVIIMTILIFITIYYLTKKDFTTAYQMEFICYNKQEKYNISVENLTIHPEYEFISSESDGVAKDFAIIVSQSDNDGKNHSDSKIYAGEGIGEAIDSIIKLKKALIANDYKCY